MGLITKIETQKRDAERFNIYIDGRYSFAVSLEVFTKFHLKNGQELSSVDTEQIVTEELYVKSFNKVLDFISYQTRTKKEIQSKLNTLFQKSVESIPLREKLKDRIIERLEELNLFDDFSYAQSYVKQKTESNKPASSQKIKEFLYRKGISSQIIEDVLAEYDNGTQLKGAIYFAEKKIKSLAKYDKNEQKLRLWRYLASKGYSSGVVATAVDTALKL